MSTTHENGFVLSGFSETIFKERYAFTPEETWSEACQRVATQMAKAESPEKVKNYEEKFRDVLEKNLFVPGGRIWYNSGRNNAQLLNCFVLTNDLDSKEGWGNIAKEMIVTSMTGGGCGVDFSDVRPKGAPIFGQKGECPGPVSLMELIDNCATPVKAGGQRRVALMFSLDLNHPDIEDFLDAKLTKGKLTHANVSVKCSNTKEFIKAVKNDEEYELSWKGKFKRKISAKKLWDKIVKNAYDSAEPGFLNWELVSSENNIAYSTDLVTTNPSLRKGTKILTGNGIFPIEQLENREFFVRNLNGDLAPAKCFLSGKNKQLYRIKLSSGIEYYATPEHKWPVIDEDGDINKKLSSELVVGDKFVNNKKEILFNSEYKDQGNYDDGFVVGWLYGDGWRTERNDNDKIQYGFIVSEEDISFGIDKKITSYLKTLTNSEYVGIKNISKGIEFNVSHSSIHEQFNSFGVTDKSEGFPSEIWTSNEEFRKGFVDGLFSSDGHVGTGERKEYKRIVFTTSHKKMATDLCELLGFYGIYSKIQESKSNNVKFPNGKTYDKEYTRYDVTIQRRKDIEHFKKIFTLTNKNKQNRLDSLTWSRYTSDETVSIVEVELSDVYEDVWDISVFDETHCFQLSNCITGNCGEIALEKYGNCCLGHLVLSRFVKGDDIDWALLGNTIRLAVRFLDNVLSVNTYPLPEMKDNAHKHRRIGLGTTALADMLVLLGYRYGSVEANKFVDKLYKFISKSSYEASVMLAVEKGMFPACVPEKHVESGFMKKMTSKIRSLVLEHGIRNCAILTIAPTGTVSILSDNCSSGIEPMFAAAYERRFWSGNQRQVELVFHPLFSKFLEEGRDVSSFVSSHELTVREHMEVQKIVQKHIDNAVSKTINMPEKYPVENMSELWLEYLPHLKGTTFYRENSRGYVDEAGVVHEPPLVALSMDEARDRYSKNETRVTGSEMDCSSGVCEI